MSSRRKKRHRPQTTYSEIVLNIMPFIDVFSLLNTFLLLSAAVISLGILEVQIPFLSNAPAESQEEKRVFKVNVTLGAEDIVLKTYYDPEPHEEESWKYPVSQQGIKEFHNRLLQVKAKSLETDKVTFFADDDVLYGSIVDVIDAIKLRWEGDPEIPQSPSAAGVQPQESSSTMLFPKVVFGSIMLSDSSGN